eukprot:g11382.t1
MILSRGSASEIPASGDRSQGSASTTTSTAGSADLRKGWEARQAGSTRKRGETNAGDGALVSSLATTTVPPSKLAQEKQQQQHQHQGEEGEGEEEEEEGEKE